MKILWLTNIILPKISQSLGQDTINVGGWLTGLSNDLINISNIDLCVIFPFYKDVTGTIENMTYYGFYDTNVFEKIIKEETPDIIHIFGTEYKHTLDMVNACEKLNMLNKVVINIQGLVHYCGKYHYYADLPSRIINAYTFRDILKRDNIKKQRNALLNRGKYEISALKKVKHVIGRTDWDKACTTQINPDVKYHFCNETLRDEFYKNTWDLNSCEKYSIFLSQGNYPIKGLHYMLEAMPEIIKKYPDAHIYITGKNPLKLKGKDKLKQTSYAKYIGKLIEKYNLQNKITFMGGLNEQQMCQRFLKSHVFVSASSIENSPNSVGEAMLLGVPTISSDVGGVKNMMAHSEDGFVYQHNAPYMLAYYVCEIFGDETLAIKFSENAKKHAKETHNRENNLKTMIEIYKGI